MLKISVDMIDKVTMVLTDVGEIETSHNLLTGPEIWL